MFDFSRVPSAGVVGRVLRATLRRLPLPSRVRVLQGPLRGAVWLRESGTAGCWLGSYEMDKQRAFAAALAPGQTVYDIGAHAGFYTLLAGRLVGPTGNVVAFEPDPRNLTNLRSHVELNRLGNVRVVAAAVGSTVGMSRMTFSASSYENQLSAEGQWTVECLTVDDAVARMGLPLPHCMKIDTEGAEEGVLLGALETLACAKPTVFLATHSPELHARCAHLLQGLRYRLLGVDGRSWQETDELVAVPAA